MRDQASPSVGSTGTGDLDAMVGELAAHVSEVGPVDFELPDITAGERLTRPVAVLFTSSRACGSRWRPTSTGCRRRIARAAWSATSCVRQTASGVNVRVSAVQSGFMVGRQGLEP